MQIHSNTINNNSLIQFKGDVRFKRASIFDRKKLCNLDVEHPEIGTLQISSKKAGKDKYIIQVGTKSDSKISQEKFYIHDDEIYGYMIKTSDLYKRKHLGEITRLASIINMLKNGLKSIKIMATDDAMMFHTKYKFEPNITSQDDASTMIEYILALKTEKYKSEAESIKKQFAKTKNSEEYINETIKLVKTIIEETGLKYDKQNPKRYWGMSMQLTEENIKKNKEFFDELLKKHGINYEI